VSVGIRFSIGTAEDQQQFRMNDIIGQVTARQYIRAIEECGGSAGETFSTSVASTPENWSAVRVNALVVYPVFRASNLAFILPGRPRSWPMGSSR